MLNTKKPQCLPGHWGSEETSSAKRCHSPVRKHMLNAKTNGVKAHGTGDGQGGADE